jgi:hypothetical protein
MTSDVKYVTTSPEGKATGSVYHTNVDCPQLAKRWNPGDLKPVSDEIVELLGLLKCRQCYRIELLEEDDMLLLLADALFKAGITAKGFSPNLRDATGPESLTIANNLRRQLETLNVTLAWAGEDDDE